MLGVLLSLFTFSLGLVPLGNQSLHAYFGPYNPKAYESLLKNAFDKNEKVKMLFECRKDSENCFSLVAPPDLPYPSVFPSGVPDPSTPPLPSGKPSPLPIPTIIPSPVPCWEYGECPEPQPPGCPPGQFCLPIEPPIDIIPPVEIPSKPPGYNGQSEIIPVDPPEQIEPSVFIQDPIKPNPKLDNSGFVYSQGPPAL